VPPVLSASFQLSRIGSVGIRGPVRPARDSRLLSLPFWSTLSGSHPLFCRGLLKCLRAPTGSARAGRAPGFNGVVSDEREPPELSCRAGSEKDLRLEFGERYDTVLANQGQASQLELPRGCPIQ